MRRNKQGFTILEMMVVVFIIGLLATLVAVNFKSSLVKARDTKRIDDVNQIQIALNLYHKDTGIYPPSTGAGAFKVGEPLVANNRTYLESVPSNPSPSNDGDCPSDSEYTYTQIDNGASYSLNYCLGSKFDQIAEGEQTAVPGKLAYVCQPSCFNKCQDELDSCGEAACGVPPTPSLTGLVASSETGALVIRWNKLNYSNTTYKLERSVDNGVNWTEIQSGITGTTYSDTGCTNDNGCRYRVTPTICSTVQGLAMTTENNVKFVFAPATAVNNFVATINGSNVTLNWEASSVPGASYEIQVKSAANGGASLGNYSTLTEVTTNSYSYTITPAVTTARYKYKIIPKAYGVAGGSATERESEEIGCTYTATTPTLNLTAGDTRITATWSAVTGATSYKLSRTGYSSANFTINAPTVTYLNTGLVNGKEYNYQVLATVCGVNGSNSTLKSATPVAPSANTATCSSGATVTYDGITYHTIWIDGVSTSDLANSTPDGVEEAGECWLKENLATTTGLTKDTQYRCVGSTTTAEDCGSSVTGTTSILGYLYTWAAAMNLPSTCNTTNSVTTCPVNAVHQGLCPDGWHIPTDTEMANLINFAQNIATPTTGSTCATSGNCSNAGKVLKEPGTTYWAVEGGSPNNFSGFTMRGTGSYLYNTNTWDYWKLDGHLWSATQSSASSAYRRDFYRSSAGVGRYTLDKRYFLTVRCVKN